MATRYLLADGERRWRAAQLVGIATLEAIVLPEKPAGTTLRLVQMSIDAHKAGLLPMERARLYATIQAENGWSVSETAAQLNVKQPRVSQYLALLKLDPTVQKLVDAGLDIDKAVIIASEPDLAKQRALAADASKVTREQIRKRVRMPRTSETKVASARFAMPGGMLVTCQGKDLTLSTVIEVLQEAVRMLKKGLSNGMSIDTQQKVMRDSVRAMK